MKLLITGGAGFIGSHLAEALVGKGAEVTVIDNLYTGREENLAKVIKEIDFKKGGIQDYALMRELVKECDAVLHLAALARVVPCLENPDLCFDYNILGTKVILKYCAEYKRKLVFASSKEVYGDSPRIPVEESQPPNPKNPYAASKTACEALIRSYANSYSFDYVILRLANVFGKRDHRRVIPRFIENSRRGLPLIVFGERQVIDFVFVDDTVNAFIKALDAPSGETINIASGKGTTVLELAKLIKQLNNSLSEIKVEPPRKFEVDKFIADVSKAKKVLGWTPNMTLEEGIRKMLE
ncbi:GDP-mannose 4,6-dehydratase [Candidatus Micrarchaeota archaeon]|nr:GDP-mannose 4,6-dehydratase [Candidatus Micrarchaeota archaeon]